MLLKEIKTTDFASGKKYTFVISMGATEQHGPFLPLGTDTYCQVALLGQAVRECPEAIFLPTLEITCSKEHKGFPGTVWIEKDTLMLVFNDICASLKDYAKNIIFVSWHGGNLSVIDRFIEKYKEEFLGIKLYHLNTDPEEILEKTRERIGGPVDDHAGNTEISMMLAINESLVTTPPKEYPKHQVIVDWDADNALKNVSRDGIADNHPGWVVNKKHGQYFINLSSEHVKNEIQRIIRNDQ